MMQPTVLIVEDDLTTLYTLQQLLGARGYAVRAAADAASARAQIDRDPPSILVTDWRLGKRETSAPVVRRLRELRPDASIVVISAYPEHLIRDELGGVSAIVKRKPASIDGILAAVRAAGAKHTS